ncbi:MAG: O-antigen ligase family protein [Nocardioides sp.]|nr:O-antigen ligase family protein [Nocardioides sp.]
MTEKPEPTQGSPLRTAVLAALIITLAGSSFESATVSSATYVARYILAALLVWITASQGSHTSVRLSQLPGPARLLISSSWLLTAVGALSYTWSIAPRETAFQAAVFALLTANMHVNAVRRWHDRRAVLADMTTIFWVLAVTILLSLSTGVLVGGRLAGLYSNPNSLGILAAFTVALGAGVWRGEGTRFRAGIVFASALSAVALFATSSRTATIAVTAGLALSGLRRKSFPPGVIVSGCFAGAAVTLLYAFGGKLPLPAVVGRLQQTGATGRLSSREEIWEYSIRLWELRPTTGYGFRAGEIAFEQLQYLGASKGGATFNSYLQVLLELGYLGMLPLAGALVSLIWAIVRAREGVQTGLAALVITGLATGLTESSLFGLGHPIAWVFWLSASALTAGSVRAPRGREPVGGDAQAVGGGSSRRILAGTPPTTTLSGNI